MTTTRKLEKAKSKRHPVPQSYGRCNIGRHHKKTRVLQDLPSTPRFCLFWLKKHNHNQLSRIDGTETVIETAQRPANEHARAVEMGFENLFLQKETIET